MKCRGCGAKVKNGYEYCNTCTSWLEEKKEILRKRDEKQSNQEERK